MKEKGIYLILNCISKRGETTQLRRQEYKNNHRASGQRLMEPAFFSLTFLVGGFSPEQGSAPAFWLRWLLWLCQTQKTQLRNVWQRGIVFMLSPKKKRQMLSKSYWEYKKHILYFPPLYSPRGHPKKFIPLVTHNRFILEMLIQLPFELL